MHFNGIHCIVCVLRPCYNSICFCSSPKELNFWKNSKGDVALFICGTTWAGDGGRSSVNGACMVISLKSSAGDGDLLKPRTGEGEFLGLFFLGDGGLGSR